MKNKLVVPFLSKALNISLILLIIATLMNTRVVKLVQAAYDPTFSARLTDNQVHGYEWNLGDTVTLTIDDPDNGAGDDFIDSQTVIVADWDPAMTFVFFDLGGFALEPGQEVSMTDGTTTKTHTVRDLAVTGVDPAADTVSGTAEPGSEVNVGHICDESTCAFRRVTADLSGNWVADFSEIGEDPDEHDLFDIVPGTSSESHQGDDDGDNTMVGWRVPNPYIQASPSGDWINAYDWPEGASLTLTIDDPSNGAGVDMTAITTVGPAPWNPNDILAVFDLEGFDLQPGQLLEVTDGTTARTMTPTNLAVTVFDVDADTISGVGDPDQEVQVCVNAPDSCYPRYTTPGVTEAWAVDYASPGLRDDEQDLVDLQPGSEGWAAQFDANGNQTWIDWRVPNPWMEANLTSNWAHAREWPTGEMLTLRVDDPSNGVGVDKTVTAVVGPALWNPDDILADFDLEGFDLQPGFILEVTDGTTSRTMTLTNLGISGFDLTANTITGVGAPGLEVQVCVNAPDRCYARYTTPDSGGVWVVDYTNPGSRDDEKDLVDLQPGNDGWAAQRDANGNQTWIDWRISNPSIEANLTGNWVHANEWPTGADLTLTIDDPSSGGIEKTATATVGPAPWNPNETMADFDLEGFDVQPGFILAVSDGATTRSMTTANLDITGFNLSDDTITGVATPGREVQICANVPNACYPRYVNSDGSGVWTADYANQGSRDDEKDLVDLQPGSDGWAAENDENGNRTSIDWRIANPWLQANPLGEWVQAREWPFGTTLTLTIDDPTDGDDIDYTATGVVDQASWDPNDIVAHFDLGGFDLQTGHTIMVTDGITARTMIPSNLDTTSFDLSADTIIGIGDPVQEVQVCVNYPDGCYTRYTEGATWAVDYAHPGPLDDEKDLMDLRAGSSGWAAQDDGQGNRTWIDWWVPNPYISDIANQTTNEDTSTAAIPFMVDDAAVPLQDLIITAESSNTMMAPVANISFGGSGANRTITIQPAPGQYGSATITVTVDNGSQTSSDTFELTVNAVNNPPTVTLTNKTTSLPENTSTASAMMVAEIVVTDDDLGTNTLALSGADAALFQIVGNELRLKAGTVLDYETKQVLNVTVAVNDAALGGTPDDSDTLTINISNVNEAPVITEDESVTVTMSQNGKFQQFSLTLHATDEDQNSTLTWKVLTPAQHGTATVSGTGTSKMISYTPAVDYFGTDSFVVEVSDGEGGVDTIMVNVTITKINQVFLPIIVK